MQTCDYCGRQNEDVVAHCVECGTSIFPDETQPASPSRTAGLGAAGATSVAEHRAGLKRALCISGGVCWILFALGFGALLWEYLTGGAGSQFFPWGIGSGGVLIGMVHVTGLFIAAGLCFTIGACFCACGLIPFEKSGDEKDQNETRENSG